MEYVITASVLGLAYFLKNDDKETKKKIKKIPPSQLPSGETVYTSKRSYNIFQEQQNQMNDRYEKALYPQDTNIVTPGPTFPIMYNKVDYTDKTLPVEFNQYQKYENALIDSVGDPVSKPVDNMKNNESYPEAGGWTGISLTGDPINPNTFTHNNQVPFFGGSVKQNLDEFSTRGIFENFTGTRDNYQKKQEQGLFFQPQKNMSNVYGTGSLDGFMLDRYYVSNVRANESPVEQIRVGPGLNQGYTSQPSGGFQQPDAQDYAMPKTVDEMRVKTKPKISYFGRVLSGEKINKPTKIGTVFKNRPDTFYIQEPDRYFTTTGQVIAPENRPCIVTKYTNRNTTELKTRTGSAAPTHGTVAQVRSKYKISNKVTYTNDGPRNADSTGQWSILNMFGLGGEKKVPNDYGKGNMKLKETIRQKTSKATPVMNFKSGADKGMARNGQKSKHTKKQNLEDNKHSGNVSGHIKPTVYDPNDIPKTTIKETNITYDYNGNATVPTLGNVVYDPNDIARTTIKETNIYGDYNGQATVSTLGNVVYDPNDIARTTIKETNIYGDYKGGLTVPTLGGVVYDPNDKPKTTMKQTTIENKRKGNAAQTQKGTYMKAKDKAKTTVRETTMVEDILGIATQARGDAYSIQNVEASETNRQNTSVEYFGEATGPEQGGYHVTDVDAPNTNRQFTADVEYFGTAGGGGEEKPMSYSDVYNATIKAVRAETDKGYIPGAMGPSQGTDPQSINATTSRFGDIQNQYIHERGVQVDKIYNSIPKPEMAYVTQQKDTLPNEPLADRINPVMVQAFQQNPYTQSLTSWA